MRIFVILILGAVAVSAGFWLFFDSVVLIWGTVIASLAKGVIWVWIFALLKRWIWIELPKLVIKLLARVYVPSRIQRKVRRVITLSKLRIGSMWEVIVNKAQALVGIRTAYALAILATISISVLLFVFAGVYVIWIVGPARLFAPLNWLFAPGLQWLQNFLFKLLVNTGVIRFFKWVKELIPKKWRSIAHSFLRGRVRRRKLVTRKIEARLRKKQKEET